MARLHHFAFAFLALLLVTAAPAQSDTVRSTLEIARPIAEVWAALTTTEGIKFWTQHEGSVDLRVGGEIHLRHEAPNMVLQPRDVVNKILAFEPGRMISYTLDFPPGVDGIEPGQVYAVLRFEEIDATHTRMHMATSGWPDGPQWAMVRSVATATRAALSQQMKDRIEASDGSWMPKPAEPTTRTLSQSVDIHASAETVWHFLTTKEEMVKWMAPAIEMDWRKGGTIRTNYNAEAGIGGKGTITHELLTIEPGAMYAARFTAPDAPPDAKLGESIVFVTTVESIGPDNTRLRIAGVGFGTGADWDKTWKFFETGNLFELNEIKKMLEPAATK